MKKDELYFHQAYTQNFIAKNVIHYIIMPGYDNLVEFVRKW